MLVFENKMLTYISENPIICSNWSFFLSLEIGELLQIFPIWAPYAIPCEKLYVLLCIYYAFVMDFFRYIKCLYITQKS